MLGIQPAILGLDAFAHQQIVLWLLDDRADQAQFVGDTPGFSDLAGGPFRGAPVEGLALVDDVVEGANDLLRRCVTVRPVRVDYVDVRQAQPLERQV